MTSFEDLGLDTWQQRRCAALNIYSPSPVQANVIPEVLNGKDVIAIAKTGSGKTAAFALPVLKNLSSNPRPFYCLVVTPTRELAIQIKEQFEIFGKPINVRVLNVIGGIDVVDQSLELDEAPHIIVSTPGRLASFMRSSTKINLEATSYFVIDEADRLLDDGFGNDMAVIIEKLPKTRQTLLFTATITLSIESLMNKEEEKNNFFIWQEKSKILTVDSLDQKIILCPAYAKDVYFIHILDKFLEDNMHQSVMIFSNSCKYTQLLGMICDKINIKNVVLHSGMKQKDRAKTLAKFKSGLVRVIISTDIASRGLDIPMVDLVINHNVPFKPKDYVHRVGRTARAGKLGKAITLVTPFDVKRIDNIQSLIKTNILEEKIDEKIVNEIFTEVAMARRESERQLDEVEMQPKKISKKSRVVV